MTSKASGYFRLDAPPLRRLALVTFTEVEMDTERCSDLPIEVEAARLAVEWKGLFAKELRRAAQELAAGATIVTPNHYRRALVSATVSVMESADSPCNVSTYVDRRIA